MALWGDGWGFSTGTRTKIAGEPRGDPRQLSGPCLSHHCLEASLPLCPLLLGNGNGVETQISWLG